MTEKDRLPVLDFTSRETWRAWLEEHHVASNGVWITFAKKGSGKASVTHDEALEVAICFGWIDGQTAKLDDEHFLQRFTPRTPRSKWSRVNCERATSLIERGEMQPAGLEQLERAKADGRWDAAYEPQSRATVPDDLQRELDAAPDAAAFFATLNSRNRYAILYRIGDAKKPETRARRIATFVEMLRKGETIH